jgi:ribosomal protein S18 acetylase RimI-like enzyme
MNHPDIRLRPATAADAAFLRRVHEAAMRPHVERVWGAWDAEMQRRRFAETTDPATHEIVERAGVAVGCQWLRARPDALELVRLWLLPEAQGRGIGTELLRRLCARSAAEGLPLRLRVLKANPARRLYARHGFRVVDETETHLLMERPAR